MECEKAHYPVSRLCRVLEVSPSGFWAWRRREPSARACANEELIDHIMQIHQQSRGTYGALRVRADGCGPSWWPAGCRAGTTAWRGSCARRV